MPMPLLPRFNDKLKCFLSMLITSFILEGSIAEKSWGDHITSCIKYT